MKKITYGQAVNEALDEEMARDEAVYCIGEDISVGLYGVTAGLIEKYGKDRVRDTPIAETAICGSCIGAALAGLRPVADLMFADFMYVAMDEFKNAGLWRFANGGTMSLPIVFRMPMGGYGRMGSDHSRAPLSSIWHLAGIKVVVPSTAADVKGLLKTAIRDNNPVCFFEHKQLYAVEGQVPEGEYTIPFGKADVKKEGKDVTLVATGLMVPWSLEAASALEASKGISVEVIDPRTLEPLDLDTIIASVNKTGRVVLVEEDMLRCGASAEIAVQIMENAFDSLDAPIVRVGAANVPIAGGFAEDFVLPQKKDIPAAIEKVLGA